VIESLESLRASLNRRLRAEGKAVGTLVLYGWNVSHDRGDPHKVRSRLAAEARFFDNGACGAGVSAGSEVTAEPDLFGVEGR
jgi:hypothetical protein